jgi:hypothetical protein
MTMKNLLALSTALIALVSVDVSASKLTLSEFFELGSFATQNKTIDEVIGISTVTPGQTNDNRNAVDDLQAAKLKLIGNTTAAIQAITKKEAAVDGITASLIDGIDYVDSAVGTELGYNTTILRLTTVNVTGTILNAGDGATPGQLTSVPGLAAAKITPILQLIDTLNPAPGNTPGIRNAVGRMDGMLAAAYRRLVREECTVNVDVANLGARQARLGQIATQHGVTIGGALPTEDQFTLAMLADFMNDVRIDALRARP